jgi:hypothetical protein
VLSVGMWIARMCFERWSHQHLKEDRRFRWARACATPAAISPHFVGLTLRWRVITERHSYEGWCGVAMAAGASDEYVVSMVAPIDKLVVISS